jgi:hypothetical protein
VSERDRLIRARSRAEAEFGTGPLDAMIAAEELADSLRDLIAALEEAPPLGDAETHLLENLRRTLAEWERDA